MDSSTRAVPRTGDGIVTARRPVPDDDVAAAFAVAEDRASGAIKVHVLP